MQTPIDWEIIAAQLALLPYRVLEPQPGPGSEPKPEPKPGPGPGPGPEVLACLTLKILEAMPENFLGFTDRPEPRPEPRENLIEKYSLSLIIRPYSGSGPKYPRLQIPITIK